VAWRGVAWRGVLRYGDDNGKTGDSLGLTVLSSVVLAVLIMTGGTEQNQGLVMGGENNVRLLRTECSRNPNQGIQCELCERWCHYSCGRVNAQAVERGNWNCDKCRTENVRMLQEDLQNALPQTD